MRQYLLVALLVGASLLAGCTGSGDGDGLSASVEGNGWSVLVTYPNMSQREYTTTSDPSLADTDGDGLSDFRELQQSTDPRKIDTDEDRLLDGPQLCPEAGSELAQSILDADILEHPNKDGCYLGESQWTYEGVSIDTKPTDAHSDNSPQIGDDLMDSEEIEGWTVTVSGETYHTFSNPSTSAPDTDRDGLHDGLEKSIGADPQNPDTDDDGVGDLRDAAPLGDLVVTATLERINIKQDKKLGGGADVVFEVRLADQTKKVGPQSVPSGSSQPNMQITFDVDDTASNLEGGHGAGNWEAQGAFVFWHGSSGGEEIHVRNSNDNQHMLPLTFTAFEDTWTGPASDGTSSGPDAGVTVSLSSRVAT